MPIATCSALQFNLNTFTKYFCVTLTNIRTIYTDLDRLLPVTGAPFHGGFYMHFSLSNANLMWATANSPAHVIDYVRCYGPRAADKGVS